MSDTQSQDGEQPTVSPVNPAPPPQAPPPPTKEKIVDTYVGSTYLRYKTKETQEDARATYLIEVGQFVDCIRTWGGKSWFEEDHINMAISMLIDLKNRNDCYVVPTYSAASLCQIGLGYMKVEDADQRLVNSLKDEKKRWIIIPCNDGMTQNALSVIEPQTEDDASGTEASAVPKKKKKKKQKKKPAQKKKPVGQGLHWGLLIIDTKNETARWLDGLLTLKTSAKNGKNTLSIASMPSAGTAAGKVLGKKGFDSLRVRREIQDMIRRAQEMGETEKDLSLKLTPQLMRILGLMITPEQLMHALDQFGGDGKADQKRLDHIKSFEADWLKALEDGTAAAEDLTTLEAYADYIDEQNAIAAVASTKNPPSTNPTNAPETMRISIGKAHTLYNIPHSDKQVFKPSDTSRQGWPSTAKELPDFAHILDDEMKEWLALNPEIAAHEKEHSKHNDVTSAAMLHIKFKKTFLTESDEDMRKTWSTDTHVFNAYPQDVNNMSASEIRQQIMSRYEPETLTLIAKYASKKRARGGADTEGLPAPKMPKPTTTTTTTGTKKGTGIDWATISDAELEPLLNDEMRNHETAGPNKNMRTYRAIMFVHNGGDFAKESEEACKLHWVLDPDVFVEDKDYRIYRRSGRMVAQIQAPEIRDRMKKQYCPASKAGADAGGKGFSDSDSDSDLSSLRSSDDGS
ncbi:hypothetical protein BDW02DRAFT_554596 [Decorospora gaudefroyi]|uniref:Uncharacterized protein n=1 Tax=Decorospora gaudefroyi TaxID=184978 RepID=A0A6A5KC81_9PLEO|nr:hypothetical protein BDW02DRAFT_554596 [Decorospora gaudefroyi]